MIYKEYFVLLSPVIGGLLALAGVYLSNFLTRNFTKNNERNKIKREKLEEAYNLVCATERWVATTITPPNMVNKDDQQKDSEAIDRIVLLCSCYSDTCSEKATQLNSSIGIIRPFMLK